VKDGLDSLEGLGGLENKILIIYLFTVEFMKIIFIDNF
jgi:hypothetical protein